MSTRRMNPTTQPPNSTTSTSPPSSTESSSTHGSPQAPRPTTSARCPKYLTRFQPSIPTANTPTTTHNQIQATSSQLLNSLKSNTQILALSTTFPTLDLAADLASKTRTFILDARIQQHREIPVGRKIGFTNRNIWPRYNVQEPIWGYVYDSTVFDLTDIDTDIEAEGEVPTIDLRAIGNLQPRIEPEIVFGIRHSQSNNNGNGIAPLPSTPSPTTLLSSISWFAPSFEIVLSPFKDWTFRDAAETTAAFALHGRLCIGPRIDVANLIDEMGAGAVVKMLEDFEVELFRDGEWVESGRGRNVLGGPVEALRYLVEGLEREEEREGTDVRLRGGEVVSTGTLTDAWPIGAGGNRGKQIMSANGSATTGVGVSTTRKAETWEMKMSGLAGVDSLKCRFVV